jgi:hypothetical protein
LNDSSFTPLLLGKKFEKQVKKRKVYIEALYTYNAHLKKNGRKQHQSELEENG